MQKRRTMAKQSVKKAKQQAAPAAGAKQSGRAVQIDRAAERAKVIKSPAPAVTAQPPPPPAVVVQASVPAKSARVKVTFVLPICDARRVSLSGEFNGWSPDATPMKRHEDGHWETTVELAPGRYEYKFVRDGEWVPDLLARENVWNRHGTLNSVVEVRA
jgi:hypothetical protein